MRGLKQRSTWLISTALDVLGDKWTLLIVDLSKRPQTDLPSLHVHIQGHGYPTSPLQPQQDGFGSNYFPNGKELFNAIKYLVPGQCY
ncbi:hypothetical protein [Spirosoma koreense]